MLQRIAGPTLVIAFYAASACAGGSGAAGSTQVAAGGTTTSRLSDLATPPATRRLKPAIDWINEEVRPSPDGRYVSMTDWSTGDLALKDLKTDSTIHLTRKGSWETTSDFAETSIVSPDGKSIAYGWYSDSTLSFDIRSMSLAGPDSGKTRVIYAAQPFGFAAAQAWTPDGRNVLGVIQRRDRTTHISIIPALGGTPRRLKSFDWRYPNNLSVSPDGRWVAYDFPPEEKNGDRDVYLLALDGSSESVISGEKGDDFAVGWSRDGSRFLYGSEKGGTPAVWAVAITNGKPVGSHMLVRSDMWRMVPLGSTRTGRLLYGVNTGVRDVFTAVLDPNTGEIASRPAAINGPSNINPFAIAWSPDGQHIAQVVLRGGASTYGPADIVVRSIDRGEVRRLSPPMSRVSAVYWPTEGPSLIVRGADLKGQSGIFAVNLETAKMTTIAESPAASFGRALSIAPGGRVGYFVRDDSTFRKADITRLDLATGAMQVLHTVERPQWVNGVAISPDGRHLGIGIRGGMYGRGIIALLPVTGGAPREIHRFRGSESVNMATSFAWSRGGSELIVGVVDSSDSFNSRVQLKAVPVSGGSVRSLGVPVARIHALRVSPDGRRVAYTINHLSTELWAMDEPVFDSKAVVAARR